VHVTGDLEAKLTHSAAKQGRKPDELVQDVLTRYFEEETRFLEAVKRGEEALDRGEYLTHEQVGQRLQRFLQTTSVLQAQPSAPQGTAARKYCPMSR
jgi:predicted transcriptional regulator